MGRLTLGPRYEGTVLREGGKMLQRGERSGSFLGWSPVVWCSGGFQLGRRERANIRFSHARYAPSLVATGGSVVKMSKSDKGTEHRCIIVYNYRMRKGDSKPQMLTAGRHMNRTAVACERAFHWMRSYFIRYWHYTCSFFMFRWRMGRNLPTCRTFGFPF
ncbi:T. brucei spp.-specific protein [Trypanosoma brucei gambiense DAL972]|uniref:T. brucei spp.-specific protein n=1 Tax=Trypanosoma brucei gambiense (strain MHOM/CI/86/DAL972) TaxID=679716 RepID=C9ZM11_TRYB9|nr:T. brucei spp.-specific protein [Trypanosoma brucei gambiense DAL972]CBH10436.1 T. brucei spp.-specific protein [Trypanosoma brucei gambiense DAL972]|eukprot:XP_011772726.1 T. brucei spp.-specific protein [Trypanosoma brucei gambiense DAL972]